MTPTFIFLLSLLLSLLLSYVIVFCSRIIKAGQSIREEGPSEHKKKSGTPTFGGVAIVLTIIAVSAVFVDLDPKMTALLVMTAGFAVIGFIDDFLKVILHDNKGILPSQKMAMQIIVAMLFGVFLLMQWHDVSVVGILRAAHLDLPWMYLPFIVFMIISMSNAANLTDGLDGLLAGTGAICFMSLAAVSYKLAQYDIMGICFIAAGALAGFLVLNFNPAKIFMGDVGSLGLGALISGVAILLHKELLLILIGGVFVIETVSVVLQVFSFKIFGRRIFKMSPLHHHFELSGMKERNVVYMFWAAAAVFGVLGVIIL